MNCKQADGGVLRSTGSLPVVNWRIVETWLPPELRKIRAQEASGGRGGGQVSVAATPKTDSVRTKAAAHAAAAAAVSVGDAIAICDSLVCRLRQKEF